MKYMQPWVNPDYLPEAHLESIIALSNYHIIALKKPSCGQNGFFLYIQRIDCCA
jgi:hypothetical protein